MGKIKIPALGLVFFCIDILLLAWYNSIKITGKIFISSIIIWIINILSTQPIFIEGNTTWTS